MLYGHNPTYTTKQCRTLKKEAKNTKNCKNGNRKNKKRKEEIHGATAFSKRN